MRNLQQLISKIDNYFPMKIKDINSIYTLKELETACCPICNVAFRENKVDKPIVGMLECNICNIFFFFDIFNNVGFNISFPLRSLSCERSEKIYYFLNEKYENQFQSLGHLQPKHYNLIFVPTFFKHLKNKTLNKLEDDVQKLSMLK